MVRGAYKGPFLPLQGYTAIIRTIPNFDVVFVQFDEVPGGRADDPNEEWNLSNWRWLLFGWHQFYSEDFLIETTHTQENTP